MTYRQALSYINSLSKFGIRPGLERIQVLLEMLSCPQKNLKFVHIAGTNGKGSVCTFVSSILNAAGLKTGLFISPFVLDFREQLQIDGAMISEKDFVDVFEYIMPFVRKMPKNGINLTQFELITAIAIFWFSRENCDIVVLETGLGGRLDATNVVENVVCSVITSISYDHTNILGESISQIATEKAGILKHNGTLVLYPKQDSQALCVIKAAAARLKNKVLTPDLASLSNVRSTIASRTSFDYMSKAFKVNLLGPHQVYNAITAITVASELNRCGGFTIPPQAVKDGLYNAKFPARFEVLSHEPLIILDGAHNPGGASVLADSLNLYLGKRRIIAIVGMLKDKDICNVLRIISPHVAEFIVVQPDNPRAMDKSELHNLIVKQLNKPSVVATDLNNAVEIAFKMASERPSDTAILVFGSLYLASQIRPMFLSFLRDH